MKTDFTVKNFKVFDENGATFHLEPITILTGCNSSGKSSMTKSLRLLSHFMENIHNQFKKDGMFNPRLPLDNTNTNLKLGKYSSIRNIHSNPNGTISLAYSYGNFIIEYVFAEKTLESLGDGWLSEILIKTIGNEEVLHMTVENDRWFVKSYHLVALKDDFFSLLHEIYHWKANENFYDFCDRVFNGHDSSNIGTRFGEKAKAIIKEQEYRLDKTAPIDQMVSNQLAIILKDKIIGNPNHKIFPVRPFDNAKWVSLEDLVNGISSKSLFYLPIFDILNNVPKESTRTVIKDWLKLCKTSFPESEGHHTPTFETIQKALFFILDDFENSKFETLLEYYIDKENSEVWTFESLEDSSNKNIQNLIDSNNLFDIDTLIKSNTYTKVDYTFNVLDSARGDMYDENMKAIEPYFDSPNNSFEFMYHTLWYCCKKAGNILNRDSDNSDTNISLRHYFEGFYIKAFLHASLLPSEIINLQYVDSSRAEIRRVYDISPNDNFGLLAKRYLIAKDSYLHKNKESETHDTAFITNWVKKFEVGEGIDVENTAEGAGLKVVILKNDYQLNGNAIRLLADEGYGITQLASVLMEIQTAIFEQSHPTIVIEEPETHLHPKFQSLLAEMCLDAYKNYGIHFIIETHSEYLIRRFQTLVAEHCIEESEGLSRDEISIYYLYSPLDDRPEGEPQVKKIDMYEDGRLKTPFGSGFLDEVDKIVTHLLQIKSQKR